MGVKPPPPLHSSFSPPSGKKFFFGVLYVILARLATLGSRETPVDAAPRPRGGSDRYLVNKYDRRDAVRWGGETLFPPSLSLPCQKIHNEHENLKIREKGEGQQQQQQHCAEYCTFPSSTWRSIRRFSSSSQTGSNEDEREMEPIDKLCDAPPLPPELDSILLAEPRRMDRKSSSSPFFRS